MFLFVSDRQEKLIFSGYCHDQSPLSVTMPRSDLQGRTTYLWPNLPTTRFMTQYDSRML